ncbi:dTDP-4-dehydrorhamnose 3,5-epimerase [bacterium]|nr:dTDP-4-dehydrorhamnose 3,5-epimerase [bacterium]
MKRKGLILTNINNFQQPLIIKAPSYTDDRGIMMKMASASSFDTRFEQINITSNFAKGVFRGLHMTSACDETKIIKCHKGDIADYCLDLRLGSSTFLSCFTFYLSESDDQTLFIPPGYAHGVEALSGNSEFIYCSDIPYKPLNELVVNVDDPLIKWSSKKPTDIIRSKKDINAPFLNAEFRGLKCL